MNSSSNRSAICVSVREVYHSRVRTSPSRGIRISIRLTSQVPEIRRKSILWQALARAQDWRHGWQLRSLLDLGGSVPEPNRSCNRIQVRIEARESPGISRFLLTLMS